MAEPVRDPVSGGGEPVPALGFWRNAPLESRLYIKFYDREHEPAVKWRDVDPITPTKHPWNLLARLELSHCSCDPNAESFAVKPREANLSINTEARRVVPRVSQAIIAVASVFMASKKFPIQT
ncbi:hypothetical protein PVAP13_9KG105860 [Panicum virgatum]|uniref:Uncharacterized protein n=1 Tax=Panicum virgatum TaxID=38727 RepID=A0A8T0NBZ8_PANVG|nr:hypothetical protein PVAP13_9KG105860 [Panicum virgatum]